MIRWKGHDRCLHVTPSSASPSASAVPPLPANVAIWQCNASALSQRFSRDGGAPRARHWPGTGPKLARHWHWPGTGPAPPCCERGACNALRAARATWRSHGALTAAAARIRAGAPDAALCVTLHSGGDVDGEYWSSPNPPNESHLTRATRRLPCWSTPRATRRQRRPPVHPPRFVGWFVWLVLCLFVCLFG